MRPLPGLQSPFSASQFSHFPAIQERNLPEVSITDSKPSSGKSDGDFLGKYGSIIGSGISSAINLLTSSMALDQNQKNFDKSLQFNREEAAKDRYFNSVSNMIAQYKAAGLNPDLLVGGASGASSAASAPAAPDLSYSKVSNPMSDYVRNNVATQKLGLELELLDSQKKNIDADTEKKEAETDNLQYTLENVLPETAKNLKEQSELFRNQSEESRAKAAREWSAVSHSEEYWNGINAVNRALEKKYGADARMDEAYIKAIDMGVKWQSAGYDLHFGKEFTVTDANGKPVTMTEAEAEVWQNMNATLVSAAEAKVASGTADYKIHQEKVASDFAKTKAVLDCIESGTSSLRNVTGAAGDVVGMATGTSMARSAARNANSIASMAESKMKRVAYDIESGRSQTVTSTYKVGKNGTPVMTSQTRSYKQ